MSFTLLSPTCSDWDHSYSILSGTILPNDPSPAYMQQFDEIICDFLKEQGVPGASLSINLQGKPIYRQGYGMNSPGVKVTSGSKFRIASISKLLTAVGIMRLVEQGELSLETKVFSKEGPLGHVCPDVFADHNYRLVTVRHLMEHSAGWDREQDDDHVFWYQQSRHSPYISPLAITGQKGLVPYVLRSPLRFRPGYKHCYSNFGYLVLGLVIESVTGLTYEDYMYEVLRQIGITDMFVGAVRKCLDYQEVHYYNNNREPVLEKSIFPWEGEVVPQYGSFPMKSSGPYGGWVSNTQNLVHILDTLVACLSNQDNDGQQWLSSTSIHEMLKPPSFVSEDCWYGLGLDIEDNGQSFGHTGAIEGTSSTLFHYKNNITWAFLLNAWSKDMDLDGVIKFALLSVAGLPGCNKGVQLTKCESRYNMLWSEDGQQCIAVTLPHSSVYSHVTEMRAQGYFITHISTVSLSDQVLFTIMWRKQTEAHYIGRNWCIVVDIEYDEFHSYLNKLQNGSFRILFLESYQMKGIVYHLFVFDDQPSCSQNVYCVDQVDRHNYLFRYYKTRDFICMSQSVMHIDKKVYISCIYNHQESEPNHTQKRWTDLPIDKFVTSLSKYVQGGLHLTYLQFYSTSTGTKVTALWSSNIKSKEDYNIFQHYDVTKYGLMHELRETMQSNLPVLFLSGYSYEGTVHYVTIWDKECRNSGAPTAAEKELTDGMLASKVKVKIEVEHDDDEQEKVSWGNDIIVKTEIE